MSTPRRLGDFEIVEEIGRGGFGVVYRARQASLDRPVAVKVLYRHLIHTDEQISRFEREARAAARLDHPALVSVYAWGAAEDDFYIAQRLIGHGRTLADELTDMRQEGQPPKGHFRRVAEWCARVAEGLHHAHERGIVHRDVKPSNILLDEHNQPCLSDFGLAKVEDGLELSRTGDFAGSPFYMSPEQADSKRGPIAHGTDIYSLGVTLYELLTLTQPFKGTTSHEIVRRILTEEPQRPARIESRVPADLETICLKAMEKLPPRRYVTAAEMAADLHAYLDGEPIAAVPISTTRRVLRSARRHREPISLALLGLLIVAGGWWGVLRLQESETDSEQSKLIADLEKQRSVAIDQIQLASEDAIKAAAARNEGQAISSLLEEQKERRQQIDETYQWVQDQLGEVRDSEDLRTVAAGFATQGLSGGLQGLQSVFANRKVADERDAVLAELSRRMKLLDETSLAAESEVAAASPAAGLPVPSPLAVLPRVLLVADGAWLSINGGLTHVPLLVSPLPSSGSQAEDLIDKATGEASMPAPAVSPSGSHDNSLDTPREAGPRSGGLVDLLRHLPLPK
jgi:serine/threonine protein kinase